MKSSAVVRVSARLLPAALVVLGVACTRPEPPPPQKQQCAPGTRCLSVDQNGHAVPGGDHRAQCAGTFPDYIVPAAFFPAGYAGPWFSLAQDFPKEPPPAADLPWKAIDFKKGQAEATAYLYALRDYAFDGMVEADFVPAKNQKRRWFHAPLMNFHNGRELVHGLTEERPLGHPELGIKEGRTVHNYAVGFYNDIGAYTFGQVFAQPNEPDVAKARFAEGAMVFKILFSAATPDDFDDPSAYLLEGAPAWQIATQQNPGQLTTVRLLQMDVAVRDERAKPSAWVFGTFAFDRTATDEPAWKRLRPVGLMWGNDPGYTPADQQKKKPLRESIVSDQIPAYAKAHLGWAGRVNGPVDNPASACMSCHMAAQVPAAAGLLPAGNCTTDAQKLYWFRNLASGQAFGAVDKATCRPIPDPSPKPVSVDFSLQLAAGVQGITAFGAVNPCNPPAVIQAPRPVTEDRIAR